jgi:hypothetical protein
MIAGSIPTLPALYKALRNHYRSNVSKNGYSDIDPSLRNQPDSKQSYSNNRNNGTIGSGGGGIRRTRNTDIDFTTASLHTGSGKDTMTAHTRTDSTEDIYVPHGHHRHIYEDAKGGDFEMNERVGANYKVPDRVRTMEKERSDSLPSNKYSDNLDRDPGEFV